MDLETIVAQKIADMRASRKLTYQQLADLMRSEGVEIHPSAIQKSEKSGRQMKLSELMAITRIFGISIGDLLGENPIEVNKTYESTAYRVRELADELSNLLKILPRN
ncbi:helix-turn-helix transcriptional regulator [Glutamicibacter protophormiae]|uniref:helix-turn-helix domain-containing protein n=1 Tax=Glutamicibacter protophormiae TaxID=37930 RepID=UPI002A7F7458|nr:helix-turn-helix transcriptional regulator [Glutamicibacter protophormiae]WPR65241.1 helix-turn-helix transcriptional regulator [Glutamicibacter protophormiae]WPR68738.1 helix-turn-helix transcriptional regulator [Glutamicibacter protophormiae]